MEIGKHDPLEVCLELVARVRSDDVPGLAAELAYRFFLALLPFLIVVMAFGTFVATTLSIRDPSEQIFVVLARLMPPEAGGCGAEAPQSGPSLSAVTIGQWPMLLRTGTHAESVRHRFQKLSRLEAVDHDRPERG